MSVPLNQLIPIDNVNDGGFGGDDPHRDQAAAITIQSAIRGFLARKEFGKRKIQNVVSEVKTNSRNVMKQLMKISMKVEDKWRRSLVDQKGQIAAQKKLNKVKNSMFSLVNRMNQKKKIHFAVKTEVNALCKSYRDRLERCRTQILNVSKEVGFTSILNGMKQIFGKDWESKFPEKVIRRLDQYHLIFGPSAFEIFKETPNEEKFLLKLENKKKQSIVASETRFTHELPFLTKMRHFKEITGLDVVHGAELNIPYEDETGTRCILVIKGNFKSDPLNVNRDLGFVKEKMRRVMKEMESLHSVPLTFMKNYLKAYATRDLLLNSAEQVIKDLETDYDSIRNLSNMLMPSYLLRFAMAPTEKQVRVLSLFLMEEDISKALFLYNMTAKKVPEYKIILRNTLHFSLQQKLELALADLEETKKKLLDKKNAKQSYEDRILLSKMDESTKQKALEKLEQLKASHPSDAGKVKKYLEGLLGVPFGKFTPEPVTKDSSPKEIKAYVKSVRERLDKAVHGQEKPKQAIMEWLAQRITNGDSNGECIGLEGPPGVGKTTFAREGIAKALGRPFVFISMGGQTDSSYLVGHGFTYVGSNWGRIIELLRESGCMDPVIYIDEVDKISQTPKGRELIGVLTALTDFAQNKQFQDKYFSGVNFNLSRALFIFTYNDPSLLNPIFRDRIQRIKVDTLSLKDKIAISRSHLMPEILKACGFKKDDITIDEEEIKFLVEHYTWEGGARKLKENLFSIVRQINLERLVNPGKYKFPHKIDRAEIIKFRDQPKIEYKKIPVKPCVGTVNGLYATTSGVGGITIVQAYRTLAKERLDLTLTGSQGDVMQESMSVARSVAWNVIPDDVKRKIYESPPEGLHIHCPEGSTPKDGPSAGGAITCAIISRLTGIPIKNDVAMTGEIDLRGRITKIGGLSAKLHGAKRAGVRLALVPRGNAKDLEEIKKKFPELLDEDFEVKIIDSIHDILDNALVENPIKRPKEYEVVVDNPPEGRINVEGGNEPPRKKLKF